MRIVGQKNLFKCLVGVVALFAATHSYATPLTPGNVVLYRVGDGASGLLNTGAAVFVDEYTPTGTLVQSIPMPSAVSGSNKQLIASGTASSEGLLSVSPNGQFITVTGYASNIPAASSLSGTTSAAVPRSIGIVAVATGAVDTSTALTDYASGNNPRSAIYDGSNIWAVGGAGGVITATLGASTSSAVSTTVTNLRQVNIFGGQLYASSGSGTISHLGTVGSGTPTTSGNTITTLPGFPTSGSQYQFFFADLSQAVAGLDTLYVVDDSTGAGIGGILKYSLVSGSWTSNGTAGLPADLYRGLSGISNGTSVTLFATRKGGSAAAGGGELVSLIDSSGYNGAIAGTPTLLATAATNTAFRGVGVVPVPEPASIALAAFGVVGLSLAARRRAKAK